MIGLMVVLLTFFVGGEYGFSIQWEQGFTTGIGFYVCNILGLPYSMHYHGVVANASDFHSSDPKYEVLYNVDLVNLLLKNSGGRGGVWGCER